jgi:basic amino acid/polyamine antiporter, APA family
MNAQTRPDNLELRKSIGLIDIAMLGAGAAIGVSIFSVLAPAAKIGGSGMLIAAVLAGAPMLVFALVYAYMASILPKSGASYEWPRLFIDPFVGFMVAWLRILGSVGVLITLSLVFVQYMSMAMPLPAKPTMFALLLVIFLLNLRGIQLSARAQTAAMALLLVALAAFVALGAPHIRLELIGSPFAGGVRPILAAVPLMIPLFLGIETATEVGEEVRDGRRVIPKGLALAFLITLVVYSAVAFTSLGLLGPQQLATSSAPLVDASRVAVGNLAVPFILIVAALAILKSLNALFIVFSRYLFAMARAGVFPAAMARVHARWGTPYVAITVAFACAVIGLVLPKNLVFLFIAVTVPTILKYLSTSVCAGIVATRRGPLAATARFPLARNTVLLLAGLGVVSAVLIFIFGFETDWRPYALIAVWGVLGAIYWLLRGNHP